MFKKKKRSSPPASVFRLTRKGIRSVTGTFKSTRKYPELLKFLIAFWFYSDGINTIIKMAIFMVWKLAFIRPISSSLCS
ncbi:MULTISPECIES: MFS transporter [Thermoactinomyces]|uniref:MFS transporter n=1 Tax=unclassified Thermoactinomyces TaxID=2634588 RepID=UPI001F5507DA|nr:MULTISPECIES: MFS transporter [Thermoactinomyces]